jgi:hypothetical protein
MGFPVASDPPAYAGGFYGGVITRPRRRSVP